MSWDMIVFWGVIIFFGLVTVICGTVFWILWNRRKLSFTQFLSDTGQWERKSWKPDELKNSFTYDNEIYKYDIKKCSRDKINRPIAHYYKGNPEQMVFDYAEKHKKLEINGKELTTEDFKTLMLSKVLRDIFQDDEVINLLYIVIGLIVAFGLAISIISITHNPDVTLKMDNQTMNVIANGVKIAIGQPL